MAINKTISTRFGINSTHHIISKLFIDRSKSRLHIETKGFQNKDQFDASHDPLVGDEEDFTFAQLPQNVMTKIIELKDIIELEMINGLPKWNGGTQVND